MLPTSLGEHPYQAIGLCEALPAPPLGHVVFHLTVSTLVGHRWREWLHNPMGL